MSELAAQLAAGLPEDFGPGPQWVKALRATGVEQFTAHGLPTHKDEAWKYTRLGALDKDGMKLASIVDTPESGSFHATPLLKSGVQINLLNGRMLGQVSTLPAGLTVLSLAEALKGEINGLKDLLESLPGGQVKSASAHGFTALNTATLNSGVVIHVAAGTDAGSVLMNWAGHTGAAPLLVNARLCIILEQDAKLQLLEQFESPHGNTNACNIVLQADLGEGASLQHIRFQQESTDAILITRTEVTQQANSDYAYFGFDLGGGLVRHDLHTSLLGVAAKSALNGAYLLDGNRHVDNHARVDHKAPGGFSDQYFRGVAGGSGRAVFNTAVVVHPGADETEARQSNANILLSARAEVDTKPELEIYADEVIASHGATVGQLDEQAVFYMRSRGLNEQAARHLLTTAFCRSVSDKLTDPVLGETISERMMDVMPQAD